MPVIDLKETYEIWAKPSFVHTRQNIWKKGGNKTSKIVENRKNLHHPNNEIFHWISSLNIIKSLVSCGFGHIYWRYLYGKLHFLCSVRYYRIHSQLSVFVIQNKNSKIFWKIRKKTPPVGFILVQLQVNLLYLKL